MSNMLRLAGYWLATRRHIRPIVLLYVAKHDITMTAQEEHHLQICAGCRRILVQLRQSCGLCYSAGRFDYTGQLRKSP